MTERRLIGNSVHNTLAGDLVKRLVGEPIAAGGTPAEVLVILESVVLGTLLALGELDDWKRTDHDVYLRAVTSAVRQRLAKEGK